jgi:hypothetical protein
MNDPGPSSIMWPTALINLQTILSLLDNRPSVYNAATYLVGLPLFFICIAQSRRSKNATFRQWQTLAVMVPLILLVIYHRRSDSKLLLLSIPACSELWAEGGWKGRTAFTISVVAVFLTGDNFWLLASQFVNHFAAGSASFFRRLEILLLVLPAPISLLAALVFHLFFGEKQEESAQARPA